MNRVFFPLLLLSLVLFSHLAFAQVRGESTDLVLPDGARIEVYYSNALAQTIRLNQSNLIGYSNELIDLGNGRTKWNLKFDRSAVQFLDELKVDISGAKQLNGNKVVTENFTIDFSDAIRQGYGVRLGRNGTTATITFSGIAAFGNVITIDPTIIDTSRQPLINYGNVLARDSTGNIWTVYSEVVTSSNRDIFIGKSTNGGVNFSTFNLTNTSDFNEALPHIDINSTDGLVISYDKYFTNTNNRQTFITTCSAGGCDAAAEFIADINVSQCLIAQLCGNNSLTVDQNNTAHITYGKEIPAGSNLVYRSNAGYTGLVVNWSADQNTITSAILGSGSILFNNGASGAPDGTGVIVSKNGSGRRLAWVSANASQFWVSYYNGTAWQGGLLLASGTIDTPPSCYAGYDKNFFCAYAQDSGSGSLNEQLHFRQANQDNNGSAIGNWSTDTNISTNGLNLQLSSIIQTFDLNTYIVGSQVPTNAPADTNIYLFTRLPNGTFTTSTIADQNRFFNDGNFLFNPLFRDKDYNGSTVRFPTSVFTGTQRYRLDYIFSTSNANTGNPHTFVFDSNALNLSDINGIIAVITPSIASPLTLDTDAGINNRRVDFNSTSSLIGIIDVNYRWFVNSTNVSTDQNYSRDFNGANADYNVSFVVQGRSPTQTFTSQADLNYLVRNAPQGLDITFAVNAFNKNADVNFTLTSTNTFNYVVWGGTDFDFNRAGTTIRFDYNASGVKQVCAVVNGAGDINKLRCENFIASRVLVKRPLDEGTSAVLTPFAVSTNDSAQQTYTAQTIDFNVFVFNAQGFDQNVLFTIDYNTSYYSGVYLIQTNATTTFHTLQPLLSRIAISVNAVFHVIDVITQQTLPNIIITAKKGEVLIGSTITDSTGTGTITLVVGDTYDLNITTLDGTILLTSTLRPIDLEYFIYVFLEEITTSPTTPQSIGVVFEPSTGQVFQQADGTIDLNQTISATNTIITSIRILIDQNGTTRYDQNFSSAGLRSQDLNAATWDLNYQVNVTVTIISGMGTTVKTQSYLINPFSSVPDFLTIINNFGVLLGAIGRLIFVVLSALVVVGGFVGLSKNKHVLVAIVLIWIGMFTAIGLNPNYVTWVPLPVFFFALLGGVAFYLNK